MQLQVIDDKPSEADLANEQTALAPIAESLAVVDQSSYDLAMAKSKICGQRIATIDGYYNPRIKQANDLHKGLIADRKKLAGPWEAMKAIFDERSTKWYNDAKEKAAEEKRKAEEIARKAAEDAQLKAAEALQAEGLTNAAEAILEAPVIIPKIIVAAPIKAEGVTYTDRYSAEVVDLMALIKAVAEGKAPISAVCVNDAYLNQWARLTKGSEAMPGVKVAKTTTQGRRRQDGH